MNKKKKKKKKKKDKKNQFHITPAGLQNVKELASAYHLSWEHHMCQSVQKS